MSKSLAKMGKTSTYAPSEDLCDLLNEVEELFAGIDPLETLEALRQTEPALYAATVEYLLAFYLDEGDYGEDNIDVCDDHPSDEWCDNCGPEVASDDVEFV